MSGNSPVTPTKKIVFKSPLNQKLVHQNAIKSRRVQMQDVNAIIAVTIGRELFPVVDTDFDDEIVNSDDDE